MFFLLEFIVFFCIVFRLRSMVLVSVSSPATPTQCHFSRQENPKWRSVAKWRSEISLAVLRRLPAAAWVSSAPHRLDLPGLLTALTKNKTSWLMTPSWEIQSFLIQFSTLLEFFSSQNVKIFSLKSGSCHIPGRIKCESAEVGLNRNLYPFNFSWIPIWTASK